MKLNITGLDQAAQDNGPGMDGTYAHKGARGGTEIVAERIRQIIKPELADRFHIIHSRPRDYNISKDKENILVLHDTWDDPESAVLADAEFRKKFRKLVFVSNFQQSTFNYGLGIPFEEGVVLQNAIDPIELEPTDKQSSIIKLIYHTTPHRGLEILIPVVEFLTERFFPNIHLDVFSSFNIYGWSSRDEQYTELFDRIRRHPNMTYHGFQPNDKVRAALRQAHIFAYPNIWPETSCISAIEAMSAGCKIVAPNFHVLPETLANFGAMYPFQEDINTHANMFANVLASCIESYWSEPTQNKLKFQKIYTDNFYNWNLRGQQWNGFLESLTK